MVVQRKNHKVSFSLSNMKVLFETSKFLRISLDKNIHTNLAKLLERLNWNPNV